MLVYICVNEHIHNEYCLISKDLNQDNEGINIPVNETY